MKRITKTLRLRRNTEQALRELHRRHASVAIDSVFGSDPGQSRLMFRSWAIVGGVFVASLQWDLREHWLLPIDVKLIPVYDTASHKYWLRGLIRRCR